MHKSGSLVWTDAMETYTVHSKEYQFLNKHKREEVEVYKFVFICRTCDRDGMACLVSFGFFEYCSNSLFVSGVGFLNL